MNQEYLHCPNDATMMKNIKHNTCCYGIICCCMGCCMDSVNTLVLARRR